jgi:Lon protease-like protein
MNAGDAHESLSIFPLHTVLYPGGLLPLRIFEPRYAGLVRDCVRDGSGFGVTPIRHGSEAGVPAEPWPLGTCAEIVDFDQGRDGLLHILARGTWRFRLCTCEVAEEGLLRGRIERILDEDSPRLPPEFGQLKSVLEKIHELESASGAARSELSGTPANVVYRLLERLPFPLSVQLEILESASFARQAACCHRALQSMMQSPGR